MELALRRNPKSYGAWHHRKWVLQRDILPTNFDHEFRLLDGLLKLDSRNFHGWNYRRQEHITMLVSSFLLIVILLLLFSFSFRFVAALKNVSEEDELKFMTDKIEANFSNYSAWHNRRHGILVEYILFIFLNVFSTIII